MANDMQRSVVRMLGDDGGKKAAEFAIASVMQSATSGDEESASASLLLCAEVFRQKREFPKELAPFLVMALDIAAASSDVCRAIAGTTGKRGAKKKRRRDTMLFAGDAILRGSTGKKEERIVMLAERHCVAVETVETVFKDRKAHSRKVLSRADKLIAEGNSAKCSPSEAKKK